jgi:uncharacterized membrane protein
MAVALGLLTLAGILFIVLGWLGWLEKLPPNGVAGIRTRYTRASHENWYATHHAAGPLLIFGGVAATMAGLAFFPFSVAGKLPSGLALAAVIAVGVLLLSTALASWLFGTRASRAAAP